MKNKLFKFVPYVLLTFIIIFIYKNWFFPGEIIGGDWPFFHQEAINDFSFLPPAWSNAHGNGLGGTILVYPLDSYLYFTGWFFSNILHIPWNIVYKFFWFGLFLVSVSYSVWFFFKTFLPKISKLFTIIGIIIYLTNTYILMLVSGGQMGIALAYGITPLVFCKFIQLINSFESVAKLRNLMFLKSSLIISLLLSIQLLFDIRIVYITLLAIACYFFFTLFDLGTRKNLLSKLVYVFIIPFGITLLVHAFWIMPLVIVGNSSIDQLGGAYTTNDAVRFFSFAKMENTISLLHPHWPENIFGKVSFMKPEFLVLPLIAFASLLFVQTKSMKEKEMNSERRIVLFFTFLGLIGVFLAKGANDPLGQVYLWLFNTVPGFVMFRDPTKFYLLIILSYSILIPFCLFKFSEKRMGREPIILSLFLLFLLFLIKPAWSGDLGGTFKRDSVPNEYIQLKDLLHNDSTFYRTLWLPRQQRFTFVSSVHPSIEAGPLFSATNEAQLIRSLQQETTQEYLSNLSVRYLIISYDPYGEIFVEDRKYNQKKRNNLEKNLDKMVWLKKIQDGKITIYETKDYKNHFYLDDGQGKVNSLMKSSTEYMLNVENKRETKLIFSENYSPYWRAVIKGKEQSSKKTDQGLNSFALREVGRQQIKVYYSAEKYYIIGRVISLATLIILFIIFLKAKSK